MGLFPGSCLFPTFLGSHTSCLLRGPLEVERFESNESDEKVPKRL